MVSIPIWLLVILIALAIILILLFFVPLIYYKVNVAKETQEILKRVNAKYSEKR